MLFKMLRKDISVLLSDKKSLMIFILMPIILTTILSSALKGSFQDSGNFDAVKIAIVKEYNKAEELAKFGQKISEYVEVDALNMEDGALDLEKIFFEEFLENPELQTIIQSQVMTDQEAQEAIENNEIVSIVYLPKGFIYNQMINFTMPYRNEIDIRIVNNSEYQYSSQIVASVMSSYFGQLDRQLMEKNIYLELGSQYLTTESLFGGLSEIMAAQPEDSTQNIGSVVRMAVEGERSLSSFTYYSIAMMAMFILYSSSYVGRELLKEKKLLTLDRGTVAGITYTQVLVSKFLMTVFLCTIQMSALLFFSKFALKVEWNRPFVMLMGILFSALAVSGVGVFISAITLTHNNYKVANIFENVLIHIFALIGGSYIPVEVLPGLFAQLKFIALNGVVLDLFVHIYKGGSLTEMMPYLGMLVGIAILFSGLAVLIVKRKEASTYA